MRDINQKKLLSLVRRQTMAGRASLNILKRARTSRAALFENIKLTVCNRVLQANI